MIGVVSLADSVVSMPFSPPEPSLRRLHSHLLTSPTSRGSNDSLGILATLAVCCLFPVVCFSCFFRRAVKKEGSLFCLGNLFTKFCSNSFVGSESGQGVRERSESELLICSSLYFLLFRGARFAPLGVRDLLGGVSNLLPLFSSLLTSFAWFLIFERFSKAWQGGRERSESGLLLSSALSFPLFSGSFADTSKGRFPTPSGRLPPPFSSPVIGSLILETFSKT